MERHKLRQPKVRKSIGVYSKKRGVKDQKVEHSQISTEVSSVLVYIGSRRLLEGGS